MEPANLAAAIGVELIGRFEHGESAAAYRVRRSDGTPAILKIATGDVLDLGPPRGITEALRARGYPAPAILESGFVEATGYAIQELLPGEPVAKFGQRLLPDVVRLLALQRDLGLPGRAPWLEDMVTSVVDGRTGYCEHGAMTEHSDGARGLLDRLRRIADEARDADVATTDAVHYDFSPYNILASDDRITGVVDWDGATSGDATFDLVTLAMYTFDYETRDEVLAMAAASTHPRALALYAAHMVLRQVDWSLRHHGEVEVEWSLGVGTDLLAAVGAG